MSRNAKLVLAAANKTPNYRPPPPRVPAAARKPLAQPTALTTTTTENGDAEPETSNNSKPV